MTAIALGEECHGEYNAECRRTGVQPELRGFVERWLEKREARDNRPFLPVEQTAILRFVEAAEGKIPRLCPPQSQPEPGDTGGYWRESDSGDAFIDRKGRIWHANTNELREALVSIGDPTKYTEIPAHFAAPYVVRQASHQQHTEAKRRQEDERIEAAMAAKTADPDLFAESDWVPREDRG